MAELSLLLVFALLAVVWHEGRRVQDIAIGRCRLACRQAGVQFLDDIAPVWRIRLTRDGSGVLRLRRVFTFDYSTPLGERRSGSIVMLGRTPLTVQLDSESGAAQSNKSSP